MSDSKEKTPTVSPDQGATGETTTSSENKEAGTQTGPSEEEEEAHYKEEYTNAVIKLLKNISMQDPELGRDILMESLLEHFATEHRSKRSEEPDFLDETKEFETYLALLKEVKAHGGHNMELITIQYILKHKGEYYWSALEDKVEAYYQNLCISRSHQEK